jgi:hypothetical protein
MSTIKSKPVYSPLAADLTGRFHLLLGLAEGAGPLNRVLDEFAAGAARSDAPASDAPATGTGAAERFSRTRVLVAATPLEPFLARGLARAQHFESADALLTEYRGLLDSSVMGTRLYIAGPEHFIGRVMQIALEYNLNTDEIRAESVGTLARRVHCVHCRADTENVVTNIVRCSGCARWLFVRDHYSRRFAAYMGVMVDAEAPGELPPVEALYP